MQNSKTTIREVISEVKSLFKTVNSDSRLTNKQIWRLLEKHSFWLIQRESDRLKLVSTDSLFQTYKCLDVIESPLIDSCCGIKLFDKSLTIYRTKDKLPKLYEDLSGPIIKEITSIDGNTSIKLITSKDFKRKVKSPYFKYNKEILAFYSDGYLYFPKGYIKKIYVEGLYTNEIDNESCEPCESCDDNKKKCKKFLDTKWIAPKYLQAQIIDAVIKDFANTYMRIPEKAHEINKNDNA